MIAPTRLLSGLFSGFTTGSARSALACGTGRETSCRMSDDQDKDSKTESPSEKKISDAADKGNLPFSREATTFASTVAIYIFFVFFLADGAGTVAEALKDIFEQPEAW
eukprot:gene6349-8086_t